MKKSDLERNIDHYKIRVHNLQGQLKHEQFLLTRSTEHCRTLGISTPEIYEETYEEITKDQYWALYKWKRHRDELIKINRLLEESTLVLSQLQKKLEYEIYRLEMYPIPALEEFLVNWEQLAKEYYRSQVSSVIEWKTTHEDSEIEYLNCIPTDILGYSRMSSKFFEKSLEYTLKSTKNHRRIDLYESFYMNCSEYVGNIISINKLQVVDDRTVQGEVEGEVGKLFISITCVPEFEDHRLKYTINTQPLGENIVRPTQTEHNLQNIISKPYKELTLDQLRYLAKGLNVPFKEYSDDRITRMRLVMSLKQKNAITQIQQ